MKESTASKVYIIHENEEWLAPLKANLERSQTDYHDWNLSKGKVDLTELPPNGVFYNRMSASSFTRGNLHAKDLTAPILAWLEANDRRVVNSRRALQLEVSKAEQHIALRQFGLKTPKTIVAVGKEEVMDASYSFGDRPFIIKPNMGGKGHGVTLINSRQELELLLESTPLNELTVDGVILVQEYIPPKDQQIVRMEFIAGKFYYAVQIDTGGSFELCPADACEIPSGSLGKSPEFTILENFDIPEIEKCEAFLAANNIEIAGMEFLEDEKGQRYFYDVNTNTNYNAGAEERNEEGLEGMRRVAGFLREELEKVG
ncbi:MAG: alpha-L-glutamate ligase [Cyclobacteriaceae bacterium]